MSQSRNKEKSKHYQLLTKYNERFRVLKIKQLQMEINSMYSLSSGVMRPDIVRGLYNCGIQTEALALDIIEMKERLEGYKARSKKDVEDFWCALDNLTNENILRVMNYQRTGTMKRADIHHLDRCMEEIRKVRKERKEKLIIHEDDMIELTPQEVELLSNEVNEHTSYNIDYDEIRRENMVKYWEVYYRDPKFIKEQKELKERASKGDKEAVALLEHIESYKQAQKEIAQADNRAKTKYNYERTMNWVE